MLVEEQKLRWCGMDMRARWRRRVIVVLTYAAFLAAVWMQTWRTYEIVFSLCWISLILQNVDMLKDVGPIARWIAGGIMAAMVGFFLFHVWASSLRPHLVRLGTLHHDNFALSGAFALMLLMSRSVVRSNGLVDNGNRGWMARAMRKGDAAREWEKRRLARMGFAVGLDGFAWYEFTQPFRKLNEGEKTEVVALHRANPHGKWMLQRTGVLFDDERLQNEEAKLRAQVQRVMNWLLVSLAAIGSVVLADQRTVSASVVVSALWTLAGLVTTLRQAIPLWNEDDPRRVAGEIALVDAAHA